jgi:hypothetical protein
MDKIPYWKYSQLRSDTPYWEYMLPDGADMDRFIVFKNKWGDNRLWFITDFIIPCDSQGTYYSAEEVADPENKPTLAIVIMTKEQGSSIKVDLLFDHAHPGEPILTTAKDMGIDGNWNWKHGSLDDVMMEKYGEYIAATERYLINDHN